MEMTSLYEITKLRLIRIQEMTSNVSIIDLHFLRQEQLERCEKQNTLLVNMRLSSKINAQSKILFYYKSLAIMKQLNTSFEIKICEEKQIVSEFLDRFVGLYKFFFKSYESSLQFKTKLESYIRPTNHNVVVDLVKYLIQFTRDYYKQVFNWKYKSKGKIKRSHSQKIEKLQNSFKKQICTQIKYQPKQAVKQIQLLTMNVLSKTRSQSKKQEKSNNILDIINTSYPFFSGLDSSSNNSFLRNKVNQLFKDFKLKNIHVKQSITNFESKHSSYSKSTSAISYSKDKHLQFPVQILLKIDKLGCHYLQLQNNLSQQTKSIKQINIKQFKPLVLTTQILLKKQKIILNKPNNLDNAKIGYNNLKILKISDNFLPPVLYHKKQKQQNQMTSPHKRSQSIQKSINQVARKMQQQRHETEDKLIQWLNKVKISKEQQRRRIFGIVNNLN